jgi:hypothetical protein
MEENEDFGLASNIPTQAKTRLEWATRPVHPSYIIAPTNYEIFKGDGSAFVRQ